MDIIKGNKKPENIKNLTPTFKWKATSKNTFLFGKKTIRAKKTVCDILKKGHKLPFLYIPSNAEIKSNSSALKKSEFIEQSIKEILSAGTVKEAL